MEGVRLRGRIQSGHRQDAVEVPFDPAAQWVTRTSRSGPVAAAFACRAALALRRSPAIVARAERRWLLPKVMEREAGLRRCDQMELALMRTGRADARPVPQDQSPAPSLANAPAAEPKSPWACAAMYENAAYTATFCARSCGSILSSVSLAVWCQSK